VEPLTGVSEVFKKRRPGLRHSGRAGDINSALWWKSRPHKIQGIGQVVPGVLNREIIDEIIQVKRKMQAVQRGI
jgi:cysteine synthase